MRVAVYGGSFNPPHVGHAMVASWLRWTGRADEVWLVPAFSHPFGKDLAPWPDRLDLCRRLAAELGSFVRVMPIEAELPQPSYTIRTLERLAADHPGVSLRLVIGADIVPDVPKWREWPRIEAEFGTIVVGRQGWPTPPGAIDFPGVSSSEIRARLRAGQGVDALVPAGLLPAVSALYSGAEPRKPTAS